MSKRRNKKFIYTAVIMLFIFGFLISFEKFDVRRANAADNNKETVNLRIIGTTDLHGQLNSFDYEQGVAYNNGGLARVFDLIQKTKAELPEGHTITLDAGDNLYDFTTEYIFSENQEAIQPIFKALKLVGYDAITLGNHDFDYGYDYILKQLDGSGMRDITVVSNVTDARTGEHPFLENMLLTRTLKTKSGNEVEIKIGIIGHTIPHLTGKTHSYAGILTGEDIVENAKKQAVKLKEMGADIIISLSHTGMGPVNPELNYKNVAYALTKIPEIDVVVCGHEHNLFPTDDMTSPYYKLPNVDKKTYLINGKNVVMAGDRGRAIGVVDLVLEVKGDSVKIVERKSELRMVTEKNTTEDKTIASIFGDWEEQLLNYSKDVLAELEPGTVIHNYFGLLADNAAIQLLNDSKINYALKQIKANEKEYIDYPVIAASTYESFGEKSIWDFVNIKDKITEANLAALQNYNSYLYVYTITGAQLKEWLEWSASAYETVGIGSKWTDGTMADLMKETGLKSLIREDWLNDWSNFYVFDGITYEIDPSKDPRYDFSGNKISTNKRVSNVRYQGKEVTDDMVLLIATNKITKPVVANKGVEEQVVLKGFTRSQAVLGDYIEQLAISGSIMPQVDYNWKLKLPKDYQFIVKVPYYAGEMFEDTSWYVKYLNQKDQYKYYIASYPAKSSDTTPPHLVVAPLITHATASPYEIAVQAADDSEIKYLRYLDKEADINSNIWTVASNIPSKGFTVRKNGIYSIYAEDVHGNKTLRKLVIENFSDNLLPRPTVNNYTNRKTKISGKAEPNTILVIETPGVTYEQKVGTNGSFSVSLPGQLADTYITVYIKDDVRKLESERVSVRINRTGPNQPQVNNLYNNMNYITGNAKDDVSAIVAIVENTAYVSGEDGRKLFEANTEIYKPSLKIVEVPAVISADGQFVLIIPPQKSDTTIKVYTLDHISRNSRETSIKVNEAGPNAPVVNEISNIEKKLTGYVPSSSKTTYKVELHMDNKVYTAMTDKDGKFAFTFEDQLYAGQSLLVVATDVKNKKERQSFPVEVIVNDIEKYVKPNSTNLILNRVTNKSHVISGYYYSGGSIYVAITQGEGKDFKSRIYSVKTSKNDSFIHYLDEKLEIGSKVYAMARFDDGKILIAKSVTVAAGRPDQPALLKEITNTDKEVKVIATKDCTVTLTIGNNTYTTDQYVLDEESGKYIYTFEIAKASAGTSVTVTAANESGTSDPLKTKVIKVLPDAPKVNSIYEGDKVITGTVELIVLNYSSGNSSDIEVPDEFKDAPSNVAASQTSVYAQIGTNKYKGTIDNEGNFNIEIPMQTEGSTIKLWSTNKAGKGSAVIVSVIKSTDSETVADVAD